MNISDISRSLSWELVPYLLFGGFIFLRVYSILRVARDISLRTQHFGLQLGSILLVFCLTPVIGLPLYLLIRPLAYDKDSSRQDALMAETVVCVYCQQRNAKEFTYCTFCGEKLKHLCRECKQPYATSYEYCPFCWAPNDDEIITDEYDYKTP